MTDRHKTTGVIECPGCRGLGYFAAFVSRSDGTGGYEKGRRCSRCKGSGSVPAEQRIWIDRGALCRLDRVRRGESLMQAAKRLGLSPVSVSDMEQGRADPSPLEAANG